MISVIIRDILLSLNISGIVPYSLKTARITPVHKKPGAEPSNLLDNFCPISNLPFLSKLLENVVVADHHPHDRPSDNKLHEQLQSGFHLHRGTETAPVFDF